MAKAAHGAKSQAIQEYLSANPTAGPRLIVDELKQKGIDVSFGLASAVKYGGKKKRKSARSRRNVSAANGSMPPGAMTGTQSIQDFLKRHPGAATSEIQKGLETAGIRVSESLIKAVKYRKTRRPARTAVRVAARKAGARRASPKKASVTVEQLMEVKRFVDELGGTDQVRRALEVLEQFR